MNDKVTSVGGVMAVEMTKELLMPCRVSCSRYTAYPEEARLKRLGDAVRLKRKCVIDEIDELNVKRVRLEGDVTELTKCADEFAIKAELNRDFSFVIKSNAMRQTAKQRGDELVVVQKELEGKLVTLKGV